MKKLLRKGKNGAQLILMESGFNLTPYSPLKDDPEFLERHINSKTKGNTSECFTKSIIHSTI
ncbi:MAG: hypothetical protein I3273_06175 [Candidatus Moeniiplasma glomeromycotorum]|nr:hypothetical protein [Candidatus Moeniiplasma glomeromycotorum]MCE8168121.1 hypothetical protein [Candidatus Moeniiplasma glomeromycotorum]MCE8169671.1 hypothetical protein [Candidatus Moeniiplasma glomeromycotorum]